MFLRSFSSILIVSSAFVIAIGQTPETKKEKEQAEQVFSWHFQGDGAYLGVQTQPVTRENFAKYGLRDVRGVAVEKVTENSPAAVAGIQAGDVILRFNGEEVTSARKLTRLIEEVDADHQVTVTIARGGSERNVTATLAKQPHIYLAVTV
jgi:serine protease Do